MLLKEQNDFELVVVIKRYGPLLNQYQRYFSPMVLKGKGYGEERTIWQRILNIAINRITLVRLFFRAGFSDIIFSNTITNGRILKLLFPFKNKIVTYVHELADVIERYDQSGDSSYSLKYSRRFAYPSLKVRHTLQYNYNVSLNNLYRLPYYFHLDMALLADKSASHHFSSEFKERYQLQRVFVVGNVGVLCDRKGADFFIDVCAKVVRQNNNIKFCWIGKFEDLSGEMKLKELILQENIQANIILTGPLPNNLYNFSSFDVLFLSSREDPYPLVVIEAALMKVPTICFENSGGIVEFVEDDAGWIIHNFSTDQVALKILELYDSNRLELIEKGETAYQKAVKTHLDKDVILSQFSQVINMR